MTEIAITGSTGVVGMALLRLLTERGHNVKALIRSDAGEAIAVENGALPVRGDMLDPDSLNELVAGSRWVFNVAGINQLCVSDASAMERVNVESVGNLIAACRRGGVERLIHTSSAVTLGEEKGTVGNEDSPHRGRFLSKYERSKFYGERLLFEQAGDLDVVSVNPSSVQGPGRVTGTGKIILDVINGKLPFLVDSPLSIVDIDDCAQGHLLAASEGLPGQRYVLSAEPLRVAAALDFAGLAMGRQIDIRLLPPGLVRGLGTVILPVVGLFKRDLPFCPEMLRVMTFGHTYDGSRAERELGLSYRPAEDTINRLIGWFRSEGLIEPSPK